MSDWQAQTGLTKNAEAQSAEEREALEAVLDVLGPIAQERKLAILRAASDYYDVMPRRKGTTDAVPVVLAAGQDPRRALRSLLHQTRGIRPEMLERILKTAATFRGFALTDDFR